MTDLYGDECTLTTTVTDLYGDECTLTTTVTDLYGDGVYSHYHGD